MREITLAPFDRPAFESRYTMVSLDEPELTLGQLLRDLPAFSCEPVNPGIVDMPVRDLFINVVDLAPGNPTYPVPGVDYRRLQADPDSGAGVAPDSDGKDPEPDAAVEGEAAEPESEPDVPFASHPAELGERQAVHIAHRLEIDKAATYLESGLSVLVYCEKLLVEHLAAEIASRSRRTPRIVQLAPPDSDSKSEGENPAAAMGGGDRSLRPGDPTGLGGGRRSELLAALQYAVAHAKPGDVVVVPHLDLLAGGTDATLTSEARELTDVLYERSTCVLLAFTDPSLVVPEVLANRFAVRLSIDTLPREVTNSAGARMFAGQALVTREEADLFAGFDAADLYKYVAGMNAVRLRNALKFAFHQHRANLGHAERAPTFETLLDELRDFKARTSTAFEVPNVPFEAIGGYHDVKAELMRALDIIGGAAELPPKLRHDLVPRGFIFHGPPGTGKTLFAKAIAAQLKATIQVVSGPEVTDMYVGESERKVRELFAQARRNAPAVIVFDEFDSIASRRSGRDDGGTRANNAVVAQLLTELDGFRPEVPVLIIGTTNRIDLIDDALLRPSRFRPIKIDLPDAEARREIVRVHAGHFLEAPLDETLVAGIAQATDGLNGDEIRSVFRDARADDLVAAAARRRAGQPDDADRPPPDDPRQLGRLIGRLHMARRQRELDKEPELGRRAGRQAEGRGRPPRHEPIPGTTTPAPGARSTDTTTTDTTTTDTTTTDTSADGSTHRDPASGTRARRRRQWETSTP